MSSTSPRTPQAEEHGLPLNKFLELLDWATPSPCTSQKCCIACKSQESPSDQLPISVEHLRATARFCVGSHHQLSFSSCSGALCRASAVLSVEDGIVRLCLDAASAGKRCLTLDLTKLVSGPDVKHTDDMLCLQFVFPFVSLLLERPRRDASETDHEAARSRELQFAAMKEAIVELGDTPNSTCQDNDHEREKKDEDCSLFATSLKKACERQETEKMTLDNAFIDFMNRGTEMVMPLCFPYNRRSVSSSALGNTCADHVSFVDAYLNQEAVWRRTIQQVDAALYFVKQRSKKEGEHTGETDEIERVEALKVIEKPP